MTHFVESTANNLIRPHLKPEQGQVGMYITIRHLGPTPIGKTVRGEAEVTAIDRRRVSLKVKVFDSALSGNFTVQKPT